MNIEDVITLDDNKDHLILDKVELNNKEYLYTVEVDQEDMPTSNYHFLEVFHESNGEAVEEVEDKEVMASLTSILTAKHINSNDKNDEQAA